MTRQEYRDVYNIVGAAMEVHTTLGRGLAEPIYQEALAVEFRMEGLDVEREKPLKMFYKDTLLDKRYFADFYYNGIIIELKAVESLNADHRAQLFNYMRITRQHIGLLFNFSEPHLRTERYLYLPLEDDFILLTQENYKFYVDP